MKVSRCKRLLGELGGATEKCDGPRFCVLNRGGIRARLGLASGAPPASWRREPSAGVYPSIRTYCTHCNGAELHVLFRYGHRFEGTRHPGGRSFNSMSPRGNLVNAEDASWARDMGARLVEHDLVGFGQVMVEHKWAFVARDLRGEGS